MKLLAIDTGETTGWVLYIDGSFFRWGTIEYGDLKEELVRLQEMRPDVVVAERVIPHGLGIVSLLSTDAMHLIEHAFPNARWITSGLWKPVMEHQRREVNTDLRNDKWRLNPEGPVFTRHIKDAAAIAVYAVTFQPKWLPENPGKEDAR